MRKTQETIKTLIETPGQIQRVRNAYTGKLERRELAAGMKFLPREACLRRDDIVKSLVKIRPNGILWGE